MSDPREPDTAPAPDEPDEQSDEGGDSDVHPDPARSLSATGLLVVQEA